MALSNLCGEPHSPFNKTAQPMRRAKPDRYSKHKLGLTYQAYQWLGNPRKANSTVKTLEKIALTYGWELSISL